MKTLLGYHNLSLFIYLYQTERPEVKLQTHTKKTRSHLHKLYLRCYRNDFWIYQYLFL